MADAVGQFLARLDVEEAAIAARFFIGRAIEVGDEKRLHVSGRAIWKIVAPMVGAEDQGEEIFSAAEDFGDAVGMLLKMRSAEPEPTFSIRDVATRLREIAEIEGRNSRARKLDKLRELFERATALEGKYLAKILIGEMRHGMSEGILLEAIARMANRQIEDVRRAHMLEGDVGRLVRMIRGGAPTSDADELSADKDVSRAIRPIKPMLAYPAPAIEDAVAILSGGAFALEHKLDGARVQIHSKGGDIRIFSRRLNDITESLPEIVEALTSMRWRDAILDGEVIAIGPDGRPRAFQDLARRLGRRRELDRARDEMPARLYVFDLIALDGELLIDRPYSERIARMGELAAAVGFETVRRTIPDSLAEAKAFYEASLAAGYEGVVAKSLASKYTPGARGRSWIKIKRALTFDLVIVAADWGYGRRKGWLSNYHLAARNDSTGEFMEIGKTFKGLTDEQFVEMTDKLLALKTAEAHGTVTVRPEVVVEVAYNDIQRSPVYASGMALRFARIVAIRDDKRVEETDTIESVREAYERQALKPTATSP